MSGSELTAAGLGVDLGGRRILDDIDLVAQPGAPLALSGPSGSGKTVLLLALAGLISPTRGLVTIGGESAASLDRSREPHFGIILQWHGLVLEMTAEENVALPLQQRTVARDEVAERTRAALSSVGLERFGDRMAGELSGGQRQRVGVARALAGSPEIVIADEPTAELDPDNRARVLSLLLDMSSPRIVVVASNDPEVSRACHRSLHLRDGRLAAGGDTVDR